MNPWLAHLLHDAGRVELRHDTGNGWRSGLFDNLADLEHMIGLLGRVGNLYTSVNAPKPLPAGNAMASKALTDADIGHHIRLVFDFDPVRPSGMPSTDAELAAAVEVRNRFVNGLHGIGWARPAVAVSGNGAHAIYRCRFPVTAESKEMLRHVYTGLADRLSTTQVHFDPVVRNPGRIWRLYGSLNRKGTPTPDRPHRVASVALPARWGAVSLQQVARLANIYAKRAPAAPPRPAGKISGKGDYRTLDITGWFAAHGSYRRPLGGGKHAVICPWEGEHSSPSTAIDSSTVVWEATTGWPTFLCSHAHCAGRNLSDVLQVWTDADSHCTSEWRASK